MVITTNHKRKESWEGRGKGGRHVLLPSTTLSSCSLHHAQGINYGAYFSSPISLCSLTMGSNIFKWKLSWKRGAHGCPKNSMFSALQRALGVRLCHPIGHTKRYLFIRENFSSMITINFKQRKSILECPSAPVRGVDSTFRSSTGTGEKLSLHLQKQGGPGFLLKECVRTRLKTNLPQRAQKKAYSRSSLEACVSKLRSLCRDLQGRASAYSSHSQQNRAMKSQEATA